MPCSSHAALPPPDSGFRFFPLPAPRRPPRRNAVAHRLPTPGIASFRRKDGFRPREILDVETIRTIPPEPSGHAGQRHLPYLPPPDPRRSAAPVASAARPPPATSPSAAPRRRRGRGRDGRRARHRRPTRATSPPAPTCLWEPTANSEGRSRTPLDSGGQTPPLTGTDAERA